MIIILIILLVITILLILLLASLCLFRHSHRIQCRAIFNNRHCRFHFPVPAGYRNASSFHLYNGTDVRLGVWHIPPQDSSKQVELEPNYTAAKVPDIENGTTIAEKSLFSDGKLVILFAHGTGSDRRDARDLYRLATAPSFLDAHVVSFDYRGFGDSSGRVRPSSTGLISDTRVVYDWIRSQGVPSNRILLWGSSLGTAVMVRLLAELSEEDSSEKEYPLAAILEAPFTSLTELLPEHFPLKQRKLLLRAFHYLIVSPIGRNPALDFNTVSLLDRIHCPLLVLHAQDDSVVPYHLGLKLYETAQIAQPKSVGEKARFHGFEREKRWDHFYMQKDPELYKVVQDFINSIKSSSQN